MNDPTSDGAGRSVLGASAVMPLADAGADPMGDGGFWLVRTIGGTRLRPSVSAYYTVRATTTTTVAAPWGRASTSHERLLVEADEAGIRELERALRESAGVQSVESEPAPDGDYLDDAHSRVVTLRAGRVVED
jgi:hypothetical protein